jgi:glutamine synthetase
MCDRFIFFRYMAKHYAKEQGLIATMMPKPFANRTGHGRAFQHVAARSEERRNLFACAPSRTSVGLA